MTERANEKLMKFTQYFITVGVTIIIACMGYMVNKIDSITSDVTTLKIEITNIKNRQENQQEETTNIKNSQDNQQEEIREMKDKVTQLEAVLQRKKKFQID